MMTKEEYCETVRTIVNNSTGIKAVELATQVALKSCDFDIWKDALMPLIELGEIIELEYVVPATDYRIKSIFFPKGTKLIKIKYNDKDQ